MDHLARWRIMGIFALHGVAVGNYTSRLPDIQKALELSEGAFGLALAGMPLAVFIASFFTGGMTERLGTRAMFLWAFPALGLFMLPSALAWNTASLTFASMLFGLAMAGSNVPINVEADRVEAATGAKIMNKCHGAWGIGVLAASGVAILAVHSGMEPKSHYMLSFLFLALATALAIWPMQPAPPRGGATARPKRLALPNRGTFLILGFALSAVWFEGVVRGWGVIYLRDALGAADWLALAALPAFTALMTVGRFMGDGLIARFGDVTVGRAAALTAFVGLVVLVSTTRLDLALAGIALIGLGASTGWPQAATAAAGRGDRPAAENVAAFAALQTAVFFVSAPIAGGIAQLWDLHTAFLLFLPIPLISFWFARELRRPA